MPKVLARGRACQAAKAGRLFCAVGWTWRSAALAYASPASPTGMRITMANPFEDPDASYRVLVNDESQ